MGDVIARPHHDEVPPQSPGTGCSRITVLSIVTVAINVTVAIIVTVAILSIHIVTVAIILPSCEL